MGLIPLFLWCLYLSIVNLQAPFTYSYGWEWLTCEVGFLCIFLCPVWSAGMATWTPPPRLVLWLIRWCAFRLLLGAGMSKVGRNSSACWRQLTCTTTHYYTQPVPNPLSWYMHHLPQSMHRWEVAATFAEQLVLPFFMLVPIRTCRLCAGILEIGFQLAVVGTGNYAWINFIGALPCIAMLDDAFLSWFYPRSLVVSAYEAAERATLNGTSMLSKAMVRLYRTFRLVIHIVLVMVMVYKSKDPIKELFGPAPWINSYDPWFLMNSQGVFGFINQHRVQVILKYTHHPQPGMAPPSEWHHLDFKCLPGSLSRRPCLMSPYHYRLDWETWIRVTASLEQLLDQNAPAEAYHQHMPEFLQGLLQKILSGDDDAAGLIGVPLGDLYKNDEPPTAVSIDFASYTFTAKDDSSGNWWHSEPIENALRAYGREGHSLPSEQIRKSPRERHWVLGICALASGLALDLLAVGIGRSFGSSWAGLLALLFMLHIFVMTLASDYEDLWRRVEEHLAMPFSSYLTECLTPVGVRGCQRCCYRYLLCSSSIYGGCSLVGLLGQLRSFHNGLLQVIICLAFLCVTFFAYSVTLVRFIASDHLLGIPVCNFLCLLRYSMSLVIT